MSTLAVVMLGESHCAAVTERHGSAAFALPDPAAGADLRPSALLIDADACWAGGAAVTAALAGSGGPPAHLRADALWSAHAHGEVGGLSLTAQGLFALLLRRAIGECLSHGVQCQRVVVVLDAAASPAHALELERYLCDALGVPAKVRSLAWAMESVLRSRRDAGGSERLALLAVLDDQALLGRIDRDGASVEALAPGSPLDALCRRLAESASAATEVPAWSRQRVWKEFLRWSETEGARGSGDAELFMPHLVDRRICRRALAHPAIDAELADHFERLLDAAEASLARGAGELCLLGDASLKLGLRAAVARRPWSSAWRITTVRAQQLAIAAALGDGASPGGGVAERRVGILLRPRPGADKQFHMLVDAGTPLPASGRKVLTGGQPDQRLFKVDLATQGDDGAPTLMRRLEFARKVDTGAVPSIELRLVVGPGQATRVEMVDSRTKEPLDLVSSVIPVDGSPSSCGPEQVARIPIATL